MGKEGIVIVDDLKVKMRWQRYFSKLLNEGIRYWIAHELLGVVPATVSIGASRKRRYRRW